MIWRVFQLRRWWQDLRSTEECGEWFQGETRWIGEPLKNAYCTRKHNHRGQHKERR